MKKYILFLALIPGLLFGAPNDVRIVKANAAGTANEIVVLADPGADKLIGFNNTTNDVEYFSAGTVTSVGFTGGLISVGSPTTTPALTVAGTSGGVPYFSSTSAWASSGLLAANALMIGGGAGAAPATTTTGAGILAFLGTPSSANLASAVTGETGSGALVFGTAPSFTTSITIDGATTVVGSANTNTGFGYQVLDSITTGTSNIAFGATAGTDLTEGQGNVLIGDGAGANLTDGNINTAIGFGAFGLATTSTGSVAIGYNALGSVVGGTIGNVAIGTSAAGVLTTGDNNFALGDNALAALVSGDSNIAIGSNALSGAAGGRVNIAIGLNTMSGQPTTNGEFNIAIGEDGLFTLTTGDDNLALGALGALFSLTTGNANIAFGRNSLHDLTTGSTNIAIGPYAGAYQTGSNSFFLNNQDRVNLAGDQTLSLLYGTFAATAAGQQLTVNGTLNTTSPAFTTSLTTPSTTFALVNTTATTVNAFGAATTINMGNAAGTTNLLGTLSLNPGGSVAGTLVAGEGTAPSLVANSWSIYSPTDVAAGGLAYSLPAAAATGYLYATNTAGVMAITHVAGAGSLTSTQVGYGDGSNLLTGEAAFTYTAASNTLGVDAIQLGATGVNITNDSDGAITFLGSSAGSDEDLTLNLDDTANTVTVSSSTGVDTLALGAIGVTTTGTSSIGPLVDSVDGTTPLNNINQVVAAGTAYTMTASYASVDFGTTDPVLTIANAGTYAIYVDIQFNLVGATYATYDSVTAKLRRTNNTAADLAGSTFGTFIPTITTITAVGPVLSIGPIKYTTANTDDLLTVQAVLNSTPSVGSVTATACTITAIRAY